MDATSTIARRKGIEMKYEDIKKLNPDIYYESMGFEGFAYYDYGLTREEAESATNCNCLRIFTKNGDNYICEKIYG